MALTDPVARLNELIQGIELAILTTVRTDSSLHSCPMAAQPVDANGAFWFLTGDNTEKVEAVRTAPRVSLFFTEPAANRFISVSGFCELIRDRNMAKELWHSDYKSWFPGGPEDSTLVLMKIVVEEADYWDAARSRMVSLTGFSKAAIL
jgi:general stress protein 26